MPMTPNQSRSLELLTSANIRRLTSAERLELISLARSASSTR